MTFGLPDRKRRSSARRQNDGLALSDDALALRFAEQQHDSLVYHAQFGCWMSWNGRCWQRDSLGVTINAIRTLCRTAARDCGDARQAQRLASAQKIRAIDALARSDPRLLVRPEQWDEADWLLNTPTGVIDLKTSEIHPADPALHLVRMTPVAAEGDCPLWMDFLNRITGEDPAYMDFLKRLAGYCLTGSVQEHAVFYILGPGANGKSIFTRTLAAILGPFAMTAAMDTFMTQTGSRHPADIAALEGARLVIATEIEPNARWAEGRIKALSGGDDVSARLMHANFMPFRPRCKIVLSGNRSPRLFRSDEAMRRRLHLLPFSVIIPKAERDPQLFGKLEGELSGILRWALDGCAEWQLLGLSPPAVVSRFTEAYFEGEDPVGTFITDCCTVGRTLEIGSSELFAAYEAWAKAREERTLTQSALVRDLIDRGYRSKRSAQKRMLAGISLRSPASRSAC